MIENKVRLLELDSITVNREKRQRSRISIFTVAELAASIKARSLIHTIVVDAETQELIAGEHRLEAFRFNRDRNIICPYSSYADWNKIPVRYATDCTPDELEAIELEENIKRTDMEWKDEAAAVKRYHQLQLKDDADWTAKQTSDALNIPPTTLSRCLQVASELENKNPRVEAATSINSAYTIVTRQQDRAVADEINKMEDVVVNILKPTKEEKKKELPLPKVLPVIQTDFNEWIQEYSGPKFNLLHCDFPYGISHHKSDMGKSDQWGSYDDSPEVYWKLVTSLFTNLDKILLPSSHIIFWFSMKHYARTLEMINRYAKGLVIDPFPLIWHKTDNKGILPDPNRGGRRTYETALFISRGDRSVVQPVAISYGGPCPKEGHLSEKSEAMLRHFFRLVVDSNTKILDPTCGSGSALRAAESLGAGTICGVEKDQTHVDYANMKIAEARKLRELSS
jgi:ParB-like chromosome segregation protein Spo0J